MLVAPHFLVGTAIAVYAPEAWPLAGLAALTSHFVLDSIPHRDTIGKTQLTLPNIAMQLFNVMIVAIIFWLIIPASLRIYTLVIGGVAIMPDLLALPFLFWPQLYKVPIIEQLHEWHTETLQNRNEAVNWFWGLLPQVLAVAVAVYFIITKPL
ncbi:MAG: hypothetical protein WC805_03905 [Patescibacteria group bacterium]|jgi:hypothetical protein